MKETITIQGKTEAQKFAHLEKILARMFRKLHHTAIGIMPKIPIMGFRRFPIDGLIARYLVPGPCILESFDAYVAVKSKDDAGEEINPTFKILIKRGNDTISKVVSKDDTESSIIINVDILKDDFIEISTEDDISEISFNMVFSFKDQMLDKTEFIIDSLDTLAETI